MISGIVCCDKAWGIGKKNSLLFNLPADMSYFKKKTEHHIVVMGYNTYLSLPKKFRPLPNRVNLILWDKAPLPDCLDGCIVFNDFNNLVNFVKILAEEYEVFICGGQMLYHSFIDLYDRVYVTLVDTIDQEATAFFPNLDEAGFECFQETDWKEDNGYNIKFTVYERAR